MTNDEAKKPTPSDDAAKAAVVTTASNPTPQPDNATVSQPSKPTKTSTAAPEAGQVTVQITTTTIAGPSAADEIAKAEAEERERKVYKKEQKEYISGMEKKSDERSAALTQNFEESQQIAHKDKGNSWKETRTAEFIDKFTDKNILGSEAQRIAKQAQTEIDSSRANIDSILTQAVDLTNTSRSKFDSELTDTMNYINTYQFADDPSMKQIIRGVGNKDCDKELEKIDTNKHVVKLCEIFGKNRDHETFQHMKNSASEQEKKAFDIVEKGLFNPQQRQQQEAIRTQAESKVKYIEDKQRDYFETLSRAKSSIIPGSFNRQLKSFENENRYQGGLLNISPENNLDAEALRLAKAQIESNKPKASDTLVQQKKSEPEVVAQLRQENAKLREQLASSKISQNEPAKTTSRPTGPAGP